MNSYVSLRHRVVLHQKRTDALGPVGFYAALPSHNRAPAHQRIEEVWQAHYAVPLVVMVFAEGPTWPQPDRLSDVLHQLTRHRVHTDDWARRIIGPSVDGKYVLHLRYKPGALLGWDCPLAMPVRLEPV